ncbi:hypothetical protein CEXT_591241 [Caerostris extrusa]|uniref:Uncharacterized protein n=1 Tax=Caerostris extrusa TaxID=172846 RepID=A0AAV4MW99_CAEEX|nr:hypothetical protein CEXT_591241 [Caerostris extrusa]
MGWCEMGIEFEPKGATGELKVCACYRRVHEGSPTRKRPQPGKRNMNSIWIRNLNGNSPVLILATNFQEINPEIRAMNSSLHQMKCKRSNL